MGFAEGAAASLMNATDLLKIEQLMDVIHSFDGARANLNDAGDRFVNLFTSQIGATEDVLREQVGRLQSIRDEMTHEAQRLLGQLLMARYADEAADALTAAASFLLPQYILTAVDFLDQAHPFFLQAGDIYPNLFGQNIARVSQVWRDELPTLRQIREDILNEAVRLRNTG